MIKHYRLPIFIIVCLFVAQIIIEINRPKPIDWEPTFAKGDKIPFGTYIVYNILPDLFGKNNIENLRKPIYNELIETDTLTQVSDNYLFITERFMPDNLDIGKLIAVVNKGASVFISAREINTKLADTLGITLENSWYFSNDTIPIKLFNKQLNKLSYRFSDKLINGYFLVNDTSRVAVLGQLNDEQPNFIKIESGNGAFFLHASPYIFTNYALTNDTAAHYISALLSHLPKRHTYWGEYYQQNDSTNNQTPLRYFMSVKALRYCIWVLVAAILLFLFFEAKRKQRIIPIILPVRNDSLDFTETVGLLYFQKGDHKNVAEKKINHFLDHLRNQYFLQTLQFKPEFYAQLADKTGVPQEDINQLFRLIIFVRTQPSIDAGTLFEISQRIDRFYSLTKLNMV